MVVVVVVVVVAFSVFSCCQKDQMKSCTVSETRIL